MLVRWSPEAADSFEAICEFLREKNPEYARRIALAIYEKVSSLAELPNRGRFGRIHGTHELVLSPLPYIVIYRVRREAVEIVRVLHGAQQWPRTPFVYQAIILPRTPGTCYADLRKRQVHWNSD